MSSDMKLIMESWRTSQLLLETDQKRVISFIKKIESNKVADEKVEKIFSQLEKQKDFLKLVNIFKQLQKEPIEEGAIEDLQAKGYVEGLQLVDYLKAKPGGKALIKMSAPLMALAYAYVKYKISGGHLEPSDFQNATEIAMKGANVDLVDIAATGG